MSGSDLRIWLREISVNLIRRALLCSIWLIVLAGPALAGAPCSEAETNRVGDRLGAVRKEFLALPSGERDDTELSPRASRAVETMKARVGELVAATMRCASSQAVPQTIASQLQELVLAADRRAGVDGAAEPLRPSFAVAMRDGPPQTLAITGSLHFACGSDTMLFLFGRDGRRTWNEILRWQSAPYTKISGAFEAFDFALSPPDAQGRWFVAAKSIAPWCSSTWSTIHYAVLRPMAGSIVPKILLNASDPIWWGGEDFGALTVGRGDFDLRFHAGSIDLGIHSRVWIRHFTIVGDRVRRVPPVAVNPRDFVDEWIVSPWPLAAEWSSDKTEALKGLHERLGKIRYFEFESVRRCWDSPDHFQVGIRHDDDQPIYYFQVRGPGRYTMAGVATKPAKACDGDNFLETIGPGR